ncbi:MAG: hypothetical protein F6K28_23180 [Microcoleus sp. SIO2G3]|nr:hypothetical protein [Microcoleus sp. SIO2G3]
MSVEQLGYAVLAKNVSISDPRLLEEVGDLCSKCDRRLICLGLSPCCPPKPVMLVIIM